MLYERWKGLCGLVTGWLLYPTARLLSKIKGENINWDNKSFGDFIKFCWRKMVKGY